MKTIFDNRNIYFNVYNMHLYLYNLLEHDLVPKHEICTDEEKEIIKKYKIMSDNQFRKFLDLIQLLKLLVKTDNYVE